MEILEVLLSLLSPGKLLGEAESIDKGEIVEAGEREEEIRVTQRSVKPQGQ